MLTSLSRNVLERLDSFAVISLRLTRNIMQRFWHERLHTKLIPFDAARYLTDDAAVAE
jgi:probable addiction module antidote protein